MTKVALIGNEDGQEFVTQINNFIKDKKVIDIKYQSQTYINSYSFNGRPEGVSLIDRALIIYEE